MRRPATPRRATRHATPRRAIPRRSGAAALLAVLCLALAGLPGAGGPRAAAAEGDRERVIVELTAPAALAGGEVGAAALEARRAEVERQRDRVLADAARQRIELRPRREHGLLVNAVSGEVPSADVERLRRLPGVAAVHPDRRLRALLDVSVPLVGAPEVWDARDPDGVPVTGAGQTVAVVDTGVDYTHPALGGGFGPGHKVVAGYDYVNDDGDPMDDHGHGTHVAGIVAAAGEVTGVAPGATITAYKALDAAGRGFESDIVAAIEDAADPANPHRADVVNLSLGTLDTGAGPLDQAVDAASEAGVLVVAAAGNAGPGSQTVMSPGSARGALTVGASTSGVRVPAIEVVAPEARPLDTWRAPYSASAPEEPLTAELVDVGFGHSWDFDGVDVEGKAVLVQGGVDTGSGPANLAEQRGAVAALISDRPSTPVAPGSATPGGGAGHDFPTGQRQFDTTFDGRFPDIVVSIMSASEYGAVERLRMRDDGPVVVRIEGADATDELAAFSSRGPSWLHGLKPEIAAPGVDVLSTVPAALRPEGAYRFSGTSMAAPHVAGAAALLGQRHPDWTAGDVRAALVGSAHPLDDSGPLAHGAGRLDVAAAADAALLASPPTLSLGIAGGTRDPLAASATVTVSNPADEPVEVTFRHEPHRGGATVDVEPDALTLDGGADAAVTVGLEAARTGADAEVSGWVVGEAGGQQVLRVPYAAFERVLRVHVPDPAFSEAEALVFSPAVLTDPPELTVTGPDGHDATVVARHDHGHWWRAPLPLGDPGAYEVEATATMAEASGTGTLAGGAVFEVLAEHERLRGNAGWQPVGPDAEGGALAPAGPRGLAVATEGPANLFITRDGGRTWRQHGDLPVAGAQVGHVAVDPSDPERLYLAVNGEFRDPTYRGKVLASADGGTSWRSLPFPDTAVAALHAGAGGVLAAVSLDGVHVSRDRGSTWTLAPASWQAWDLYDSTLAGDDLYVATVGGLWVLRGLSAPGPVLEPVETPGGPSPWVYAVTGDGGWLFASILDVWTGTVYRSADAGLSWEPVMETEGPVMSLDLVAGQLVATGFPFVRVSTDAGDTWTEFDEPVQGGLVLGAAAWEQPGRSGQAPGRAGQGAEVLLGVQAAGVWSAAEPAGGWRRIGVQGVAVNDLAMHTADGGAETLVAGTRQDVYRTAAPTAAVSPEVRDWGRSGAEGMIGTDVRNLAVHPGDADVLYRTLAHGLFGFTVDRSDDGGQTWQTQHHETGEALDLLVHPAAPERVYVSYGNLATTGLLVSGDGGETWGVHLHPEPFDALAGDPHDPDRLWLGTRHGLYRSDDGGVTAELVEPGAVSAIAVDPREPDRVVVGGEELRVSGDGGATFEAGERAPLPVEVSTIVTSPADPDVLFAGTRETYTPAFLPQPGRGVLASHDGGRTWENVSGTLQNRSVSSLALTADGRYLFAGTTSGGVHRLRVR